jgi:hypothetical protein
VTGTGYDLMRRRLGFAIGATALLLIGAVALAAPGGPPDDREGGAAGRGPFQINGNLGPVYPLVESSLTLTIENPANFEILVTELTVTVGDASMDCLAANLQIDPVAVPFTVPRSGERLVVTSARLVDDAADACQRAVFPLAYEGSATKP